ncbi:hypothetical protein TBK1r_39640 [Stieleria magnilauensis]|uniref:Phosphatidylinositol-4,5-bisphosphate 4-phosphatase n=1 Tax=Stieleria magnilauensis TaxID=2527963 RepID=A0ABX5XSN6_9BACT|nr:hypothetical protein TBK1r_39640 [Planctomycetes bacterium TBK1r]
MDWMRRPRKRRSRMVDLLPSPSQPCRYPNSKMANPFRTVQSTEVGECELLHPHKCPVCLSLVDTWKVNLTSVHCKTCRTRVIRKLPPSIALKLLPILIVPPAIALSAPYLMHQKQSFPTLAQALTPILATSCITAVILFVIVRRSSVIYPVAGWLHLSTPDLINFIERRRSEFYKPG